MEENYQSKTLVSDNQSEMGITITDVDIQSGINNKSYSSGNETEEDEIYFYYFYKTEQMTFLWVIFILIVTANSSVIGGLLMSKNRKTRMNFFIMQLAIADLGVGLINVLTDIIWRTTVDFYGGNVICKLIKYLQVLVTYSSTYVLVALSIDRYDAITHPMNFSGSWRRSRLLVGTAWGLSVALSVPAIFLNEEEFIRGHTQCWIDLDPWEWQIYITLVAMSLFFIPALVISACYAVIVYTIWTKSQIMGYPKLSKSSSDGSKVATVKRRCSSSDLDRKRASSRGIIPRAKIKTVKMTFVIVFVFILCWSPYFLYDLLQVYGYIPENQTTIAVSTFIQSLAPLNSAANPIIYCLFSTKICKNPRKLSLCSLLASKISSVCPSKNNALRDHQSKHISKFNSTTTTKSTTVSGRSTLQSRNSKLSVTLFRQRRLQNENICMDTLGSQAVGNAV